MQMTAIRASSLPELFDCPARWEAKPRCGRRLPRSAAAQLGTAVHAGAAVFDVQRILGSPITPDDAAGEVVDAIHHPREDVDWGEDSPREAERIALALHGLYCRNIAPARNYVAVEATCERLEITDLGLALTGTTDRITTGKTAVAADGTVRTAGHAAQIGVYELLAGAAIGQPITAPAEIIGLQVAKTDKGRRAAVGVITGARELLVGTEEQPGLLQMAARMIRSGDFYGNPKSQTCTEKYCLVFHECRWRR
mgnify:CR=1 FL=1